MSSLTFTLLGPVRAWRGETEIDLGTPKQRAFLALLLLQPGHPLSPDEIVAVLWGDDPPDSAHNQVQRHVGLLRRLFESDLKARGASRFLVRGSGGYRLDVDPEAVDLGRFRALRQQATAASLLEALALWRGPVAAGIPDEIRSHPAFVAVDGEYLSAVKSAADLALEADPEVADQVLGVVRDAAARHPLDEALQARLMLILAATGKQAEALEAYRTTRQVLADDLGLDPGAELQAAHQRVLKAGTEKPPITLQAPAQLPADLAAFAGRRHELDLFPRIDGKPRAATVVTISGMAGVGKTTLAVHWAHRIADHFPDGQLYLDLHGFHPGRAITSPADALHSVLESLGVPAAAVPASLEAQSALFRSLLARRRMLIVLDNARDTAQVRPLLPGSPGCLTVVTSRNQLYDLVAEHGATPITLERLPYADATELLSRRLGADRVALEQDASAEIVELTGRLPLTLAMVSARAAMNPRFSLAAIAGELQRSHGSLDAFVGESSHSDIRSIFDWSYQVLTPAAARLFRLLAIHPGPDCSLSAAASIAGETAAEVRQSFGELQRANLVAETEPGRFAVHDLLRAYARELVRSDDMDAACRRLTDYFVHSAAAAGRLLFPGREETPLDPPAAGSAPASFRYAGDAVAWFDAERPALIAAVKTRKPGVWQLSLLLEMYLDRIGAWLIQVEVQTAAREAADTPAAVAGTERALGFAEGRLGRWATADRHLARALEIFTEIGDSLGQGRTHRLMAFLLNRRLRHDEALSHYAEAADLYEETGFARGLGYLHNEIGWTYILIGDHAKALEECRLAIESHRARGDRNGQAAAWDSMGYAQHHLGAYDEALESYSQAMRLYRSLYDRSLEAETLVHIGDTHQAAGRPAEAALAWRQALEIFDDLGHPDAGQVLDRMRLVDAR
ncbi:BTAD domain-containing putative transcriptional regulator [Actinoplanes sp. NPDC051411]|uniref:AfsR/SARP family transcriptional regulator n=1 Tax=Actinoplanes sp. NPDC051411 TaxID=3155522 RepID=UPI00343AAACD